MWGVESRVVRGEGNEEVWRESGKRTLTLDGDILRLGQEIKHDPACINEYVGAPVFDGAIPPASLKEQQMCPCAPSKHAGYWENNGGEGLISKATGRGHH